MSQLIDGKKIAEKIKDEITQEIFKMGQRPNLAIILIEGREDSQLYVSLKEREAKKVGIDTHLYKMPDNVSQEEILGAIEHLNEDELIDGILVQLPLPKNLDTDKIIKSINPEKDVDGFHPLGLKKIDQSEPEILSPVYGAILEMLKEINFEPKNKKACIISNSLLFGENLTKVLGKKDIDAEWFRADEKDLTEKTKEADLLISAVGRPHFIKKEMVKEDAIIIDVGINKKGKKVEGDVDFEDVEDNCAYISPVPGGVGPLTIAMTFANTLKLSKKK